jgi:hypothetical protein
MSDRDFFREVDEALRQEKYKKLWDRYGVYALAAAVLLVAGVAGYKAWSYWQQSRAEEAGAQFSKALTLDSAGDASKAREAFAALAEKGPEGYRVLARFQLAAVEAQAGETDNAVATYDALSNDANVDPILKGYAAIQAATLKLDTADYAAMQRRLTGLVDGKSPWKYSARELLGLSAYRLNDMAEAEKQFSELIGDQGTPSNLRERADMMLALVVGTPQALSTTAK